MTLHLIDLCSSSAAQVLTKALQLHPTAAGLWSHAAAWELQHNGNAAAARTLMQRGLRMARASDHLWLEYFRLELTYAQRLATRRRVLGIDGAGESFGHLFVIFGSN